MKNVNYIVKCKAKDLLNEIKEMYERKEVENDD